MLVGVYKDEEITTGRGRIYQAAVLLPCLKQIENHLKHRIKNIQLVGADQICGTKPEAVMRIMVSQDSGIFEN